MQKYEKLEKIGEGKWASLYCTDSTFQLTYTCIWIFTIGTYGTVFKAKNKETQEIVALKRVRLDDDDEVSFVEFLELEQLMSYTL